MKLNIFLIFVALILILYLIVKISILKENYQDKLLDHETVNPIRINEVNNLAKIKLFSNEKRLKCTNSNKPRNIFVGDKNQIQNNPLTSLNTNDTIFIKDGIRVSRKYNSDSEAYRTLDIEQLKAMKYLPYNFDFNLCIDGKCASKNHLKMLKGRMPFYIKTFLNVEPYIVFSQPNFTYGGPSRSVWKTTYGTYQVSYIGFPDNNGGKSLKITNKKYKITVFQNSNFEGQSLDLEYGDHKTISLPGGEFRSFIPKTVDDDVIRNMCMSKYTRDKTNPGGYYESWGATPCDLSGSPDENQFFYIKRNDLILNEHTHDFDPEGIHMHDHAGNVEIHDENYHL